MENGRIVEIKILDGGRDYYPSSNTITVVVDYNDSTTGYGFRSGPIHTSNGVLDEIIINDNGTGFSSQPKIFIEGGGQNYAEGESVHMRVVTNVAKGVKEVRLVANGVVQNNRPFGEPGSGAYDTGFVEVVANDPYYDLFWVPDRNPNVGIDGVDGVGIWSLSVQKF